MDKEKVRLAIKTTRAAGKLDMAATLLDMASKAIGEAVLADPELVPELTTSMEKINLALTSLVESAQFISTRLEVGLNGND